MKKLCLFEIDNVLFDNNGYSVDVDKAKTFVKELTDFCDSKGIKVFFLSGFHKNVVLEKIKKSFFNDFFSEDTFFCVDDSYIAGKEETDAKLHKDNLEKDSYFRDAYFKQTIINSKLKELSLEPKDVLLLGNDIWVDGYYTMKFSKVDFALFKDNLMDRGKPAEPISGLAYYTLDFDSVKLLLENFPKVDFSALDKYVFNTMKDVLLKDVDFSGVVKKAMDRRMNNEN